MINRVELAHMSKRDLRRVGFLIKSIRSIIGSNFVMDNKEGFQNREESKENW